MFCYDYYVPKQETGMASVKNTDEITLEFVKEKKIIGTMHSHNDIGVSFSGTDDQCTNHSFIKNHIVTNNKHDFFAVSRIELPCGLIKFAKAKVIMQAPRLKHVKGVENIEEIKWPVYTGSTYYHDSRSGTGFYGNKKSHVPAVLPDTKDIDWDKRDRRQHAFMFDQKEHGGVCNGEF